MRASGFLLFLALLPRPSQAFDEAPPYECSPRADTPRVSLPASCLLPKTGEQSGPATDAFCRALPLTVVTESEASSLFREFAADPSLPFRFLPDGCQARAQRMAQLLLAKGIQSGKVFIKGKFELENPWDPLWPARWQYHTAPVLLVKVAEGRNELRVIDPSLFARPVTLPEFASRFASFKSSRIDDLYLTGPFTYELNHRDLELYDFRPRDLECGAQMIHTGLIFERLLRGKSR